MQNIIRKIRYFSGILEILRISMIFEEFKRKEGGREICTPDQWAQQTKVYSSNFAATCLSYLAIPPKCEVILYLSQVGFSLRFNPTNFTSIYDFWYDNKKRP